MHRISPVSIFWVALLTVAMVGCGSDAASTTTTVAPSTTADGTDVDITVDDSADTTVTDEEPTTTVDDSADTTVDDSASADTTEVAEQNAEIAAVCDAYLESISFGTIETGLDKLIDILGPDAPPGVQDALDRLVQPEGDIESYFVAQNTVDSYVLPICRDRFSASVEPAVDDAAAADAFLAAIRDGDRATAERLAPTNVIVDFDWNGFPDATGEFSADNSTISMLLEPTVTVFCQLSGGAVESCAFGE